MRAGDQCETREITMELVIAADIPQCRQVQYRFSLNLAFHKDAAELMSGWGMQESKFA
jgi:hypothetical protein